MSTTDFLPSIVIGSRVNKGDWTYNNMTAFELVWTQSYEDESLNTNPAKINCWDLIDKFTELSEENRQAMKDEVLEISICPDTA